jgi:hypothetical protein
MSTLKVDSIKSSDGNTDLLTLSNGSVSGVNFGRRNLIINGELLVNQRGNVSGGNVGNNTYTYDRWVTVQSVSANTSDGSGYGNSPSIRMDATATASAQVALEQRIENPSSFNSVEVTVSAWVKSNSSNCFINIYDFGWNGLKSNAHTGGGNWELLTVTGTLNSGMTDLRVRIGLSSQGDTSVISGDYFEFTQVQMERGSVATPFEHRSYGEELALCQRYYFATLDGDRIPAEFNNAGNNSKNFLTVWHPVTMRADPTVTFTDGNGTANVWSYHSTAVWSGRINGHGHWFTVANPSHTQLAANAYTGYDAFVMNYTADAEL